jgi:Flp pilus assembly protein CpaB
LTSEIANGKGFGDNVADQRCKLHLWVNNWIPFAIASLKPGDLFFGAFFMRSNRKIFTGVALLAAALLIYGIYVVSSNARRDIVAVNAEATPIALPVSNSTRMRAVAAFDIPARSIITPEMLKMVDYNGPANDVFVNDHSQAIGYITRVPIPADAPLQRRNDLIGHISEVGIAGALRVGTRALVVPIANKPTLHDLVRVGNYVDILAAFDSQESRTLVQNVRVLAVDVFGNDFPEVNVAMRGPYKANAKTNSVAPVQASPSDPNAPPAAAPAPTPAPTPVPQNAVRPEPALTLEVTPQQAAAIQLAIQSGAAIDYLLVPALPGNLSSEPVLSASTEGTGESGVIGGASGMKTVSVTKSQIAPYAERKKSQGGQSSNSGGSGNRPVRSFNPPNIPDIPLPKPLDNQMTPPMDIPLPSPTSAPQGPPPTYQIPIYADGKVVRNETVLLPQR